MIVSAVSFVIAVLLLTGGVVAWNVHLDRKAAATRATLQSMPEASLVVPGSTPISTAYDAGGCFNGAASTQSLNTGSSRAAVLAFYQRELAARGWQMIFDGSLWVGEYEIFTWSRGGNQFRLATAWADQSVAAGQITVYATTIIAAKGRC